MSVHAVRRLHTAVPVIVGVGEFVHRPGEGPSVDPLSLAVAATRAAAEDAATPALLGEVDTIDVVSIASWLYDDAARQLAEAVGASPSHAAHSTYGGHQPVALLDAAAARIAAGRADVALVAGAEAMRSVEAAMRAGDLGPWPEPPIDATPMSPHDVASPTMTELDLVWPADVYPLYEQAGRRAAGLSQREARAEAATRWSVASQVAAGNPAAWLREPRTADEIATVSPENRMVSWPYPKLLTALPSVDQAAAVLVTSTETATRLGIGEERWVFPWGGAGASEVDDVFARATFERTPAGGAVLDGALALAGLDIDGIDLLELYSCFPCVPRMAAAHLGVGPERPTTVTGGLTFFGGPGNNYMLHAIAAMTRALRAGRGGTGLLYGQGGYATKHHAMVLAREPSPGYAVDDAGARQASVDAIGTVALLAGYEGEGTLETFAMPYGRDEKPARAIAVARTPDGARFTGPLSLDDSVVSVLTDLDAEPLGRPVKAFIDDERTCVELA